MNPIPILTRAAGFPANRINAVYAQCRLSVQTAFLPVFETGCVSYLTLIRYPGAFPMFRYETQTGRGMSESRLKFAVGKHKGETKMPSEGFRRHLFG